MKTFIFGFLSIVALIFIIGSAYAWSNGNIGFIQLLIQMVIGVAAEWFILKNIEM